MNLIAHENSLLGSESFKKARLASFEIADTFDVFTKIEIPSGLTTTCQLGLKSRVAIVCTLKLVRSICLIFSKYSFRELYPD